MIPLCALMCSPFSPGMFHGPMSESMIGRAQEKGLVELRIHDIRDFTQDKHRCVDDYPFGGGPGMVMMAEPVWAAVQSVLPKEGAEGYRGCRGRRGRHGQGDPDDPCREEVLPRDGQGVRARGAPDHSVWPLRGNRRASQRHLHGRGIHRRLRPDRWRVAGHGDSGRHCPPDTRGSGDADSATEDSFWNGILDYPHYTRPRNWRGMEVPEVLLSGDHERIRVWRRTEALRRTLLRRPDLLETAELTDEDKRILKSIMRSEQQ